MAKFEIPKLPAINDMDNEQYQIWYNQQLLAGKLNKKSSTYDINRLYKNQLFVQLFGEQLFWQLGSPAERDKHHQNYLIQQAYNELYKDYLLDEDINSIISPESQRYLLENGYIPKSERLRMDELDMTHALEVIQKNEEVSLAIGSHGMMMPGDPPPLIVNAAFEAGATLSASDKIAKRDEQNLAILLKAKDLDNSNVLSDPQVREYRKQISTNYLNMLSDDEGAQQLDNESTTKFLEYKVDGQPLFPYFTAYKDEKELENFDIYDKIELASDWDAILTKASTIEDELERTKYIIKAADVVNEKLLNIIHNNRKWYKRAWINTTALTTKAVSNIGNTYLGIQALALKSLAEASGKESDKRRFEYFLQGLDENGQELPFWLSLEYFSKMDRYNRFSRTQMAIADANGGISTRTHVTEYGKEFDKWTKETLGEGFAMLGYTAASIITEAFITKGSGIAPKLMVKALLKSGVSARRLVKLKNALSNDILRSTGRFAGDLARLWIHSTGEGVMEGKNNFDLVYQEVYNKYNNVNTPEGQALSEKVIQEARNQYSNFDALDMSKKADILGKIRNKFADEIASEAAAKSFMSTYYSFVLKNSVIDAAFNSYLFLGRTPFSVGKNSKLKFKDGKAFAQKPTAWDITKAIVKPVIGGYTEEFTDEMVNQGSQMLGLNHSNNYLQYLYLGTLEPYVEETTGAAHAYLLGALNAAHDPSTYHQAFVGAIAPFTNSMFNVAGAIKYASMSQEAKAKLSKIEKISSFIFNPIISNLSLEYSEYNTAIGKAQFYNESVAKLGDNMKNVMETFNIINDLEKGKLSGDPRTQKDAEHTLGYNFIATIYKMAQDGDVDNLASNYLNTIKRLSSGRVSAEELAEFMNKPENTGKYKGEQGKKDAIQAIKKNALKLYELFENYGNTRSLIEHTFSGVVSERSIEQLTYMSLLSPHLQKRKELMEMDLGITSSTSTRRGYKTARGLNREKTSLDKLSLEVAKILSKKDGASKVRSPLLEKIQKLLHKRRLLISAFNEDLLTLTVLTVDLILNASALERYDMFENKEDYSLELLEEIEKAETILEQKDHDWRTKLRDIAELEVDIDYNQNLFKILALNPSELDRYNEYLLVKYLDKLYSSYINLSVDTLEIQLSKLEVGSKEWHAIINKYGLAVIQALKKLYEQEGALTPSLLKALNKAEKLSRLISTIYNIVNSSQLPDAKKKNLISNIEAIVGDATSFSKAIKLLQDAIDNPNIAEDVKEYIRTILEKIEKIEKLKKATTKQESNKNAEEVLEPNDDATPKDSQEYVLTNSEDINIDEDPTVSEELPEEDSQHKEEEVSDMDLDNFILFGNVMTGYVVKDRATGEKLLENGILRRPKGASENDYMSTYFKWLESKKLSPQKVIDHELSALKAMNVPVQIAMLQLPKEGLNSPLYKFSADTFLLVVKADDKVKKVHNPALSDYIIIKGEQYLVIGSLGYKTGNETQKNVFFKLKDNAKVARNLYFKDLENTEEEFFLIPDLTLSIGNISLGSLAHLLEDDTAKLLRSISELLELPKRNPRQIGWDDLIWVIPTETALLSNKNVSINMKGAVDRVGHLFLAIKDSRGKYIPVQMKNYVSEDIKDGAFKDRLLKQINDIIDGVLERNHNKRLVAVKELSKYLLFRKDNAGNIIDNILIGTDQNHSITIVLDGVKYSFTELDIANNKLLVIDKIIGKGSKFKIAFTKSTITNNQILKEMDEAGVLTTDIAILGTNGAAFSVIKGHSEEEAPVITEESTGFLNNFNKKNTILLNGKTYRYIDNRYVNENGEVITDEKLLSEINIINQCENMESSLKERGGYYYILNSDVNNLQVIYISGKSNNLKICSKLESLAVLRKVEQNAMLDTIAHSAEDIELDIETEGKEEQVNNSKQLENKEKINAPVKKEDVFDKNFGKSLQDSKNNHTFAEISRNPEHRSKIYALLKGKFGEEYTKATDKEAFLRSKGITTTSIQDVEAWMEHIKNCK